ncbi:MAG: septal ring lytic transglycosylase RlpA family protein [Crocinitomicaceae bacterium]|nr:septal ring lytic transglycosylase RlpA family protein [Crocinitomicaceae bacterium]
MKRITFILILFISFGFVSKDSYTATGKASFYHVKFQGKRTASGEVFDQNQLTAAHKSLPFGTMVEVRNLSNDSIVVVKINDRLSQKSGFLIDVSTKAAKHLNFIRNGHAKVSVKEI